MWLIPHSVKPKGLSRLYTHTLTPFSAQAFRNHKIVDVFHRPGECDLTVNVDFAYLAEAVADLGMQQPNLLPLHRLIILVHIFTWMIPNATQYVAVTYHGLLSQATFLQRMGLQMRVEALQESARSEDRKKEIATAAQRLIDLTGMGSQYQVMGLSGKHTRELWTIEEKWPFVAS